MPGAPHETKVVLLREHPEWLRALVALLTKRMLPAKLKVVDSAVRVVDPAEVRLDLVFVAARATSKDEVNGILKAASEAELKGILDYNTLPLVSMDYNHSNASSVFDSTLTKVSGDGTLVKVLAWYDNEWGFSNRMLDTTIALMKAA